VPARDSIHHVGAGEGCAAGQSASAAPGRSACCSAIDSFSQRHLRQFLVRRFPLVEICRQEPNAFSDTTRFIRSERPAGNGGPFARVKLTPDHVRGTLRRASRLPRDTRSQEDDMGRAMLLWLIGIPIPIILIIWLLGGLHG
jgi:hypothetical protein